jgi:hypothetical protein
MMRGGAIRCPAQACGRDAVGVSEMHKCTESTNIRIDFKAT